MSAWVLTPEARDDLFEIWSWIASNNLEAADRLEADILAACAWLADGPDRGHFRRDLTERPVRFWTVRKNYAVVYDPTSRPLEIIRVLHWARDTKSLDQS